MSLFFYILFYILVLNKMQKTKTECMIRSAVVHENWIFVVNETIFVFQFECLTKLLLNFLSGMTMIRSFELKRTAETVWICTKKMNYLRLRERSNNTKAWNNGGKTCSEYLIEILPNNFLPMSLLVFMKLYILYRKDMFSFVYFFFIFKEAIIFLYFQIQ